MLLSFIGLLLGVQTLECDYYSWTECIFPIQSLIYDEYKDELNIVGLDILYILSTFFSLYGFVAIMGIIIVYLIWELFKEIFFVTFRKDKCDGKI